MRKQKEEMLQKAEKCFLDIEKGKECNVLDFHYRLVNIAKIGRQSVPVEVLIHARLEKCTEGFELGKLVYSTTLFPGEKVKLFTMDRRTRFSFDKESELSYRNEQTHESQYYMTSMDSMMSDLSISDERRSNNASNADFSTSGSTSGAIGTVLLGASVDVKGSYNAASSADFARELSRHAEASHNRSVEATHSSSSVSIGEVQSRSHAEGESESHFEASSRSFANANKCHAVTYLFHQINQKQRMKFTVVSIKRRVIDATGDTRVVNKPKVSKGNISILPSVITADHPKRLEIEERARVSENFANIKGLSANSPIAFSAATLFTNTSSFVSNDFDNIKPEVRQEALQQVDNDLIGAGLLSKKTNEISSEIKAELSFELKTSLPTAGLMVKSYLDECSVCEPTLEKEIILDLERKQLENELLKKQIDLLEKSQVYRCCPVNETDEVEV